MIFQQNSLLKAIHDKLNEQVEEFDTRITRCAQGLRKQKELSEQLQQGEPSDPSELLTHFSNNQDNKFTVINIKNQINNIITYENP